jgi:hypothetical protein
MDVDRQADRIAAELCDRHPLFARRTVERLVQREFLGFLGSSVTAYLPLLVRRRADAALRDLDFDFDADQRHDRRGAADRDVITA